MNNLLKVVTQQRRGRVSNPRLLDRKSDALPLSHRATPDVIDTCRRIVASCDMTLIAVSKRRSLLMAGDDDGMFMTRSLNVTPKIVVSLVIVLR